MNLINEVYLLAGREMSITTIIAMAGYIIDLARIGKSLSVHVYMGAIDVVDIEDTETYDPNKDPSYLLNHTRIKSHIISTVYPRECSIISAVHDNKIILNFYITKSVVL